jgi:peptide chain release factor 3
VLGIQCAPVTWPIGMGKRLKGVVHLVTGEVHLAERGPQLHPPGFDHLRRWTRAARAHRPEMLASCATSSNWCRAPAARSTSEAYLAGQQTPVFFGSGINNFGVQAAAGFFVDWAPPPQPRDHHAQVEPAKTS